jgi:hypothetical protein
MARMAFLTIFPGEAARGDRPVTLSRQRRLRPKLP